MYNLFTTCTKNYLILYLIIHCLPSLLFCNPRKANEKQSNSKFLHKLCHATTLLLAQLEKLFNNLRTASLQRRWQQTIHQHFSIAGFMARARPQRPPATPLLATRRRRLLARAYYALCTFTLTTCDNLSLTHNYYHYDYYYYYYHYFWLKSFR